MQHPDPESIPPRFEETPSSADRRTSHDAATGGWNEPGFRRLLEFALEQCRSRGRTLASVHARLEGPPGWPASGPREQRDSILATVAQELSGAFDSALGRSAGDEFVVLICDPNLEELSRAIDVVTRRLRAHPLLRRLDVRPRLTLRSIPADIDVDVWIANLRAPLGAEPGADGAAPEGVELQS